MKKTILAGIGLTLALAVAGCSLVPGKADKTEDQLKKDDLQVGIVLPARDEPRWIQDEASFTSILGDAGFSSEVLFSQGSSARELSNVESLIDRGIDVLVICAQDATAAAQWKPPTMRESRSSATTGSSGIPTPLITM